jgi:hypothetical protein
MPALENVKSLWYNASVLVVLLRSTLNVHFITLILFILYYYVLFLHVD